MPELPEVSYFKKYIDATALHQEIVGLNIRDSYILEASEEALKERLIGQKLEKSIRHGKYILLQLTSGEALVFHFGMTGHFEYLQHDDLPKYAYFTLIFDEGARLCLVCPRKLARVHLASSVEDFIEGHKLGVDALKLDLTTFKKLLSGKGGTIKGALLDQHLIAGLGNMYADEVLFQARIHPKTSVSNLDPERLKALHEKIKPVLEQVISSQAEDKELPEHYLTRYRKDGADCPVCKNKIQKIKVSGRSTYFCPDIQKES